MADSRKQVTYLLIVVGALGILFGAIHLFVFFSTGSGISLADAGINAVLGWMGLLAAWFALKGRFWAIVVAFLYVLTDLTFAFLFGRGLNFLSLVLGTMVIVWLIVLWRRGVLL